MEDNSAQDPEVGVVGEDTNYSGFPLGLLVIHEYI